MLSYCIMLLYSSVLFLSLHSNQEKKIVIVTPSYNNSKWYQWNADSVLTQEYSNYHWFYTDDCSPDRTGELVAQHVKERGLEDKVTIIINKERKLALENLYTMIHQCDDHDIIAILDGDDALAHPRVLQRINEAYQDDNTWLTYGQFIEWPTGFRGFCRPYQQHITEQGLFRQVQDGPSHLRTFYAGLFKKIKKEDLMRDELFFGMTYDLAIMFPMLEMAGKHHAFISDILVLYNVANQINDHKVNQAKQAELARYIRSKERYKPLDSLFEKKHVGLLIVATGKYIQFVEPLITSARRFFCPDCIVTYYVFTDGKVPAGDDIVQIYQERMGWPYDTMFRCKLYHEHKNLFEQEDYLFACDADMLFVDTVGSEILSERVATEHPGFVGRRGTYEENPASTACVAKHEGTCYFAGGFHGGSHQEFLKLTETMITNIMQDLKKNMIAVWHDESHLNRYFIDNPPTLILSPSYCYPESWHLPYHKRLLALDKNHKEIRE